MQRLKTGGVMVPLDTAAAALCFAAQRGVLGGGGGLSEQGSMGYGRLMTE